MIQNTVEVYCLFDNFVKYLNSAGLKKHPAGRKGLLSEAEYMFIIALKHSFGIRTNSNLYYMIKHFGFASFFSKLPSYQQFNDGIKRSFPYLVALTTLLAESNKNKKSKYYIVDSTPLPICSNGHRYNVKIDNGLAKSSKNLNGWFHGFKLHIVINHNMDIVGIKVTDGSTKDYNALEGGIIKGLIGWLVGDKGYISSKVSRKLSQQGLNLLVKSRKNMKKLPVTKWQNFLFSQRERIEGIFSMLKLRFNMLTNLARSLEGFFTNVFGAIVTFLVTRKQTEELSIERFEHILIS